MGDTQRIINSLRRLRRNQVGRIDDYRAELIKTRPFDPHRAPAPRNIFHQLKASDPETHRAIFPVEILRPGSSSSNGQNKLTEEQRRELDKAMWERAFSEQNMTLEDLLPFRLRVAWRLVREMAWVKGYLIEGKSLRRCLPPVSKAPDNPWTSPISYSPPEEAADRIHLRAKICPCPNPAYPGLRNEGLPLLPPPPPDPFPDDYDPATDPKLQRYLRVVEILDHQLGISHGSPADPYQGYYGLSGLTDPYMIRLAFPRVPEIFAWDDMLTVITMRKISTNGYHPARDYLFNHYGLQPHEIDYLVTNARAEALRLATATREEKRAMMEFRLEDVACRAKEDLNIRVELQALKALAVIQGLGQSQEDDPDAEFGEAIEAGEDPPVIVEAPSRTLLAPQNGELHDE